MASHCCQSDVFSGQRTIDLKTREVQPGVRCSSIASASRCRAVARLTTLVRAVPAFINVPWNQLRECSRCRAERMCPSFCKSSQTISVGRCWRRRRPRIRWPVPKASIVTPLRSTIELSRHTSPRPTASGKSLASRRFSSNSALRFSRWAQAWCLVSETIQMYGSQHSTAARSGRQSVPMVDLAPPRGPSTLSFVPRSVWAGVELFGQPAVHVRRRPAKVVRQILLAPGQQIEAAVGRGGPTAAPGRAGGRSRRATSPTIGTHRARLSTGHSVGDASQPDHRSPPASVRCPDCAPRHPSS